MDENSNFKQKILVCLKSSEDFKNNSRFVREELLKQNKETIAVFIDTIEEVLTSKEASPEARFYSLFFLKLTTEHHNPHLLSQLANRKKLLKNLEEQATYDKDKEFPERGSTFFKSDPTEKEKFSGSNYLALLLEIIKYWNQKYAPGEKKNNPFGVLYRRLSEDHKVPFPKNFHFYKSKEQKIKDGSNSDSSNLATDQITEQFNIQGQQELQQSQQQQAKASVQNTEKQENLRIQMSQNLQGKNGPEKTSSKNSKQIESEDVKNAREKINNLKNVFKELQSYYNIHKVESSDVEATIEVYYDILTESHKPFADIITVLLMSQDKQNEEVTAEILPLNEKALELEHNFKQYRQKQIGYAEHRVIALKHLELNNSTPSGIDNVDNPVQKNSISTPNFTAKTNESTVISNRPAFGIDSETLQSNQSKIEKIRSFGKDPEAVQPNQRNIEKIASSYVDNKMKEIQLNLKDSKNVDPVEKSLSAEEIEEQLENEKFLGSSGNYFAKRDLQEKKSDAEQKQAALQPSKDKIQQSKISLYKFDSVAEKAENSQLNQKSVVDLKKHEESINQSKKEPQEQVSLKRGEIDQERPSQNEIKLDFSTKDLKRAEFKEEISKKEDPLRKDDTLKKEEEKFNPAIENRKSPSFQTEESKIKEPGPPIKKAENTEFSKVNSRTVWNENLINKEYPLVSDSSSNEPKNSILKDNKSPIITQSKLPQTGNDISGLTNKQKETRDQVIEEIEAGIALKPQKIGSEGEEEKKKFSQSQNLKFVSSQTEAEKLNSQSMAKLLKPGQNASSIKFSSDLKLINRSFKLSHERTADLKKIQDGIKRSFATSQKKLPPIISERFLADPVLLSNIEKELHLLRSENEALRNSTIAVGSNSQDNNLMPVVSELQKQITDFKKEIEQLKKKNELLEKSSGKSDNSGNESTKKRLVELEAENKNLKKRIEANPSAKAEFEENKKLQDKIKELSRENERLADTMNHLKLENQSLSSKLIELEDLYTSKNARSDEARSTFKTEERHSVNYPTNKAEVVGNKAILRPNSPESYTLSNHISPKVNSQSDWATKNKSPDAAVFWNGLKDQLSPIESRVIDSSNPVKWQKGFISPRTQNVEVGKRAGNNKIESDWLKNKPVGGMQQINNSNSQDSSDANERYETPDEDISGAEDLIEAIPKEEVPKKYHFFGRETGKLLKGGFKVEDQLNHHIFSSHKGMSQDEDETEKEQVQNFVEFASDSKGYDYEWVQKLSKKTNGIFADSQKKNPFESEPEFNEELKGTLVPSTFYVFEGLRNHLQLATLPHSLHYFKMACLKSKCPIFENNVIQVGASSNVIQDYSTGKHQLKLTLFFNNKSDEPVTDFTTTLTEGLNLEVTAKPERIESIITTSKQAKQIILVSFKTVPVSCLQMNCRGICGRQTVNFSLFLPTTINKFMEFRYVDSEEFKAKWKTFSPNILKSEGIVIDNNIIHNAHDFKKYFAYLVDLEPDDEYDFIRGMKSIKLGGVFDLKESGSEYAIKINFSPSQEIVFQVATSPKNIEYAKFIIQNLIFLFKK